MAFQYSNAEYTDDKVLPSFGGSDLINPALIAEGVRVDIVRPQWEKDPLFFIPFRELYQKTIEDPDNPKKMVTVPAFRPAFPEPDVRGSASNWFVQAPSVNYLGLDEDQGGTGRVSFVPYWRWEVKTQASENPYYILRNMIDRIAREREKAKKIDREPRTPAGWDERWEYLLKGSKGKGASLSSISNQVFMFGAVVANDKVDFVTGRGLRKSRWEERKPGSPLGVGKDDNLVLLQFGSSIRDAIYHRFWRGNETNYQPHNQKGVFGQYKGGEIVGGHLWCAFHAETSADVIKGLIGENSSLRSIEDLDPKTPTRGYHLATLPEYQISNDVMVDGSLTAKETERAIARIRPFFPENGDKDNQSVLWRPEFHEQAVMIAKVFKNRAKMLEICWSDSPYLTDDVMKILASARSVTKLGGGEPARGGQDEDDRASARRRTDDDDDDGGERPRGRRDVTAPKAEEETRRPARGRAEVEDEDDGGEERPPVTSKPKAQTRREEDDDVPEAKTPSPREEADADETQVATPKKGKHAVDDVLDDDDDAEASPKPKPKPKPKKAKAEDEEGESEDRPVRKGSATTTSTKTSEKPKTRSDDSVADDPGGSKKSSTKIAAPAKRRSDDEGEDDDAQGAAAEVAKGRVNGATGRSRRVLEDDDEG
jgi:hypothetical protein